MDLAFTDALLPGLGATAAFDAWALLRRRLLGVALPDYGQVGRWVAHLPRGRFRHASIAAVQPVRGELAIGWIVHVAVGVAFAALLLAVAGPGWRQAPTLLPALAVGIGTVTAPWLLMQPGMGAGIAARLTAHPWRARVHGLFGHAVFGAGLYLTAVGLNAAGLP